MVETTGGKNGDTREEQHRRRERERGGVQPARTWSRSFEAGRSRSHHRRARRRGRPAATRIASAAAKCAELKSTTRAAKRKTIGHSPVSSVAVGDGDVEAMAREPDPALATASRSGGTTRESGWVMVVGLKLEEGRPRTRRMSSLNRRKFGVRSTGTRRHARGQEPAKCGETPKPGQVLRL